MGIVFNFNSDFGVLVISGSGEIDGAVDMIFLEFLLNLGVDINS